MSTKEDTSSGCSITSKNCQVVSDPNNVFVNGGSTIADSEDWDHVSQAPRTSSDGDNGITMASNHQYPVFTTTSIEAAAAAVAAETNERKQRHVSKIREAAQGRLEEEKQQGRLAANRRSAALSRQRKKDLIEQLRQAVSELSRKNVELHQRCDLLEQQLQMYQNFLVQNFALGRFDNNAMLGNAASLYGSSAEAALHATTGVQMQMPSSFGNPHAHFFSAPGLSEAATPSQQQHAAALQAFQLFHLSQQQPHLQVEQQNNYPHQQMPAASDPEISLENIGQVRAFGFFKTRPHNLLIESLLMFCVFWFCIRIFTKMAITKSLADI